MELASRQRFPGFASREASPSATTGWYVVWLHRRDGAGVYLALAHGSTNFRDGALIARSDAELAKLMAWSRSALSEKLSQAPLLRSKVDLASRATLAVAYEKSCVAAFYYPRDLIPADDSLRSDMKFMADLLGRLYEAERLGKTPLSQNPDVAAAEAVAASLSKPLVKGGGQGFALTACERKAIELHAMALASAHLQAEGFAVKDVSANESFDLLATRKGEAIKVEVKGTTGSAAEILLTRNEVELHKSSFPNNALIVVHSMLLSKGDGIPVVAGGTLEMRYPWNLDPNRLSGISFSYRLI